MNDEKNLYMVEFDLPQPFTEDFIAKIPEQRHVIDQMLDEGHIKAYSLALDRSKLWAVMVAASEFEVYDLLDQFPLRSYMEPHINELMFHNAADRIMSYSLN